ncbi:MAG: GNAT family N-acetyltransferase [Ilumatobacteraceae bacterium]|nr:GNAT family N-acetyltransferase [Ilumatobacteraceae bacterium]
MHLADRMHLPEGYRARPYRGPADHGDMTGVLVAYREHLGDPEYPTVEQLDASYAHLIDCDPNLDIVVIEHAGTIVGYVRVSRTEDEDGTTNCILFAPIRPDHLDRRLFDVVADAQEAHMLTWLASGTPARFRAFAAHPGPGRAPTDEAEWLEARGFTAVEWGASLVRPHLDEIPDLALPNGVVTRPVRPDERRAIWEAHLEAFRGEWDFEEPTPEMVDAELAEPYIDHTLWKVAWVDEPDGEVVGQVKSFINTEENEQRGYRRGYTEQISTHPAWRNRGIAGALLAMSLRELRDRGMTEAALGVDTNNPGGAFQLYTRLGFELRAYEAVYSKDVVPSEV